MNEVLKTVQQTEVDKSLDHAKFYQSFVRSYRIRARAKGDGNVPFLSLPKNVQVDENEITTIPLFSEEFEGIPPFSEVVLLEKSLYLALNQLVKKRFIMPTDTKLIPEVGLSDFGFIIGTVGKSSGPIAFVVTLPALKSETVPKSNFLVHAASS